MTESFSFRTRPEAERGRDAAPTGEQRGILSRVLFRSLRTVHLFLLATLIVALVAVLADSHYRSLGQRRQLDSEKNLQAARTVAAALDSYLRGVLAQQATLGLAITSSPPPVGELVDRLLRESARQQPAVRRFDWVSPQGLVVASSHPEAAGTFMSEEPSFHAIADGQEWATSDLYRPPAGEDAAFAIGRGVRGESGALLGVVVAVVDPALLDSALSLEKLRGGSIALLDRSGRLVNPRAPRALSPSQRSVRGDAGPPMREPQVLGGAASGVDLRPQAEGMVPVPSLGWAVAVLPPQPTAASLLQTPWDFWPFLLVTALMIAAAVATSRLVTVPIYRLKQQALAMASGDSPPQVHLTGPRELTELAEALNQMSADMRARDELREDYTRAIAHDLSTPLTVIHGRAQLLERILAGTEMDRRGRQSVEAIITAARRINGMANDLVDSARAESGQLLLSQRPVDLRSFVCDLKQRLAGVLDVERLQVEAPEGLPRVWVDPQRLERILINLLTNAFKYSPLESRVTVVLQLRDAEMLTSVEDHGMGVSPEEQPRLFQRYYRTRQARARREGLGLGLYLSRKLTEAHNGRIWVESEPDKGTAFRFTLPLAPPHEPPRARGPNAGPAA